MCSYDLEECTASIFMVTTWIMWMLKWLGRKECRLCGTAGGNCLTRGEDSVCKGGSEYQGWQVVLRMAILRDNSGNVQM